MSLDNGVIERAYKLSAELPNLIAPTQSDYDAVQMLREIERLRAALANREAVASQDDARDVEASTYNGLSALGQLRAMIERGSVNDGSLHLCSEVERALLAQEKKMAAIRALYTRPVPASQDDARDAERYRACRYVSLTPNSDPLIMCMGEWDGVSTPDEFDEQIDKIVAILAAKKEEK